MGFVHRLMDVYILSLLCMFLYCIYVHLQVSVSFMPVYWYRFMLRKLFCYMYIYMFVCI